MLCYWCCKGEQKVSLHRHLKIQRKRRAIANPKIHFRKIDGRDTRTSNFPAYAHQKIQRKRRAISNPKIQRKCCAIGVARANKK